MPRRRRLAVNDELGHAAGDAVLVEIAGLLGGLVREGDVVARLGGDELAVVLLDVERPEAERVAERARQRVRGSAGVLGLPWTVSVGAAWAPQAHAATAEELLRSADLAMYEDKRARRDADARSRPRTARGQRPSSCFCHHRAAASAAPSSTA